MFGSKNKNIVCVHMCGAQCKKYTHGLSVLTQSVSGLSSMNRPIHNTMHMLLLCYATRS